MRILSIIGSFILLNSAANAGEGSEVSEISPEKNKPQDTHLEQQTPNAQKLLIPQDNREKLLAAVALAQKRWGIGDNGEESEHDK